MKATGVTGALRCLSADGLRAEPPRPEPPPPLDLVTFFERRLPAASGVCEGVWQDTLYAPLREFLGRAGKLLRARLVAHGWRLAGGCGEAPQTLCLLPELLHSASLIVDDIQDGAVLRRGGPALHRVIGPERALNAANWLYFWPYRLLDELRLPAARRRACAELITATLLDCHRGQALDLGVQVWALAQDELPALVAEQSRLKTGRLTALCVGLGALAAGARPRRVDTLQRFGEQVGVALQMLDDLTAVLLPARHDKAGEDLAAGRPTFAWVLAAQRCSAFAYRALQQQARAAAGGADWQAVRALLAEAIGDDALDHPRAALAAAGGLLRGGALPAAAVQEVLTDLERLERAYG
jgi:geranylgeranyl pyrophosphate synthase